MPAATAADHPTGAEARAAQKAQRREELLDAAIAVVRRDGPFVSMDQIAAGCGITKPIIYRHFGDRDGLVGELALRFVDRLISILRPAAASAGTAHDLLATTMDAYLGLIETDTNLYRFLAAEGKPESRDVLARLIAEHIALIIEQRLAAADLDTAPARPWAYGLVGMVHFAGDWWIDEQPIPRHELAGRLTFLAWDGLGSLDLDRRTAP